MKMKFSQLAQFIVGLFLLFGILYFVLSSDILRVAEIEPKYNLNSSDSIASIFYSSGEQMEVYPNSWIDIICRRTGRLCGELSDFNQVDSVIERFIDFQKSASVEPWLLQPSSGSDFDNKVIYVSKNGSDDSSGEITAPLLTVQKAIDISTPGTTILVEGGDYSDSEFIEIEKKASAEHPIRLIADATTEVILPPVHVHESQYIEVTGFTIYAGEILPENWVDMPAVFVDNPTIMIDRYDDYESIRKEQIEKKYKTWHEFLAWEKEGGTSSAIKISNSDYITVTNNELANATYGLLLQNDSRRIYAYKNYIHHNLVGILGSVSGGDKFSFSESLISNNDVEHSFRTGIAVHAGAHHNVIANNVVRYSGTLHLNTYQASGNNMFIFNRAEYGGYYTETMRHPGSSALSLHSCKRGCIAFGNYLAYQYDSTGADGNGIIIDFTAQGAYVASNIIFKSQGSGITSTKSGNSHIINNTIVEAGENAVLEKNSAGIRTADPQRDIGNIIANNIIHNPSGGGILFKGGGGELQKYVDYNIFSFDEKIPLVVNDDPQNQKMFLSIDDLEQYSTTHSREEIVTFIEYKDVDFKQTQYSPGSSGAKEELMPKYNFFGEVWETDSFGAL